MKVKDNCINFFEKWGTVSITLLSLIVTIVFKVKINELVGYEQLFTNTITFVSILIGVLMSMLGFLLGFSDEEVVNRINDNNGDRKLINYFLRPIVLGIITVILSMILHLIFKQELQNITDNIYILMSVFWITLFVLFLFSTIRIILIMYLVLRVVFKENKSKSIGTNDEAEIAVEDKNIY